MHLWCAPCSDSSVALPITIRGFVFYLCSHIKQETHEGRHNLGDFEQRTCFGTMQASVPRRSLLSHCEHQCRCNLLLRSAQISPLWCSGPCDGRPMGGDEQRGGRRICGGLPHGVARGHVCGGRPVMGGAAALESRRRAGETRAGLSAAVQDDRVPTLGAWKLV